MDVLTTEHKNLGSNPIINDRAVTNTFRSLHLFAGDIIALITKQMITVFFGL